MIFSISFAHAVVEEPITARILRALKSDNGSRQADATPAFNRCDLNCAGHVPEPRQIPFLAFGHLASARQLFCASKTFLRSRDCGLWCPRKSSAIATNTRVLFSSRGVRVDRTNSVPKKVPIALRLDRNRGIAYNAEPPCNRWLRYTSSVATSLNRTFFRGFVAQIWQKV